MTYRAALLSAAVAGLTVAIPAIGRAANARSILFIGNSFTLGAGSAVHHYRNHTVTDLNHEQVGGVPALFKVFTEEAGLLFDVALETCSGVGLDYHLQHEQPELTSRPWDIVIAQGYSTLDRDKPRDPTKLIATSKGLADLLRSRHRPVQLFLTSTWSRPDQVYPATGAWAGTPITRMASDIRHAYDQAATVAGATVIPVGDAFNRAVRVGLADANPYDGIDAGKIDLWTTDNYHASTYGYYLDALMVFGRVTGRDPRSLGDMECAAMELGVARAQVGQLQQIAFDELAAAGPITPNPKPKSRHRAVRRCPAN